MSDVQSLGNARQRGAATLVIVMVLFFIMAMMAAYANRNLIFEQRIASNYYRSGVGLEAAEAGSEWALGMLNGLNINAACTGSGNPTSSFRERYLGMDSGSRTLSPLVASATSASCVRIAAAQDAQGGWTCQCPAGGWAAANVAPAAQMQPSFHISFEPAARPGVVRLISHGCTGSQSDVCQTQQGAANAQLLGGATVRVEAALISALKMPPAMPLVVKQTITDGTGALGLHNSDPRSSGLLLQTGGSVADLSTDRLDSLPGTPGQQALLGDDQQFRDQASDLMFAQYFGMPPAQYKSQPAMRSIPCTEGSDCSTALLAAFNQGMRMIWVDGPLTLSSNVTLGSAALPLSPLVIVANGPVTITGPLILNGLLYVRGNLDWSNTSGHPALVNGAVIAEGNLLAAGRVDMRYHAGIMDALRNATGSFVRVPGSWWDQDK
ncbi:pilus assembly PilX family protein [Roseateles violae]|uniref:PilX N-terminal domain-containing pilus assembly protein n=1 Tax=Roseateles violae TaxID=3058042 RepID=A0ABT8DQV0_9BURK|nr:PilX N-terminal domain-containing pilus assembly protein [Pelomonas sp. PFR6]MDN3920557.1 PilX N-terminal domain-containing pilus assembly protein [Pelomonas sp. PFR6]